MNLIKKQDEYQKIEKQDKHTDGYQVPIYI